MKINIAILFVLVLIMVSACVNSTSPKGNTLVEIPIPQNIFEVVYSNFDTNKTPFAIVRNPFKDTIWVFTTDFYKKSVPRLAARRMISFKDTIINIEEIMGVESTTNEVLTPICPFDSVKFDTYFISNEEVKHYKNNKIFYEFDYFFKKGKNFEKYISRTYYNIESNSYRLSRTTNDSTGILFEDKQ